MTSQDLKSKLVSGMQPIMLCPHLPEQHQLALMHRTACIAHAANPRRWMHDASPAEAAFRTGDSCFQQTDAKILRQAAACPVGIWNRRSAHVTMMATTYNVPSLANTRRSAGPGASASSYAVF
jgi:hypothetical protein